jgi:hypothetical protein
MNKQQKQIIHELLKLSIENGFDCYYPLKPIVEKLGITEELYNEETESGLLWPYANWTMGAVWMDGDGNASISWEQHDMLEHWSDFGRPIN